GRGGGAGRPSREVNGLLPAGRDVNGLLPAGRGALGRGAGGVSARAAGASGSGSRGGVGGKTSSVGANAGFSGSAGAGGAASTTGAAAFFAAAFLAGFASASGTFGNCARTFATTGASMVDEAVLTNSPLLFSHSISCLDCKPTSLARADTRCLATDSPSVARGRCYRKPLSVHGGTHRYWLIERSWCGSALSVPVVFRDIRP